MASEVYGEKDHREKEDKGEGEDDEHHSTLQDPFATRWGGGVHFRFFLLGMR